MKKRSKLLLYLFFFVLLIVSIGFIKAGDLNFEIEAEQSYHNTNLYLITDSDASAGYDPYDVSAPPIQSNETRLFSWCKGSYPGSLSLDNCAYVLDSWPIANRTFYLVHSTSPTLTANLTLSWDTSDLGTYWNAYLTDYGEDYGYSTAVSDAIDMEDDSSYTVSKTSARRYLKLVVYYYNITNTTTTTNGTTGTGDTGGGGGGGDANDTCSDDCSVEGQVDKECVDSNTAKIRTCAISSTCTEYGEWSNQECTGANPFCYEGDCVECKTDPDCEEGFCVNNECSPFELRECISDRDCELDQECVQGICTLISELCDPECRAGYICRNKECVEGNIPDETDIPDDLERIGEEGCSYNFICGEWSSCLVDYNVADLITGEDVEGRKTRSCIDKEKCLANFMQEEECSVREEVIIQKTEWCLEQYIEISRKETGEVVARLKQRGADYLDVSLNLVGEGYCPSCYDNIKNFDEEEIDCGGKCKSCSLDFKKYNWFKKFFALFFSLNYLFWVFFMLMLILTYCLYYLIKHKDVKDLNAEIHPSKISFKNINSQYKKWKKMGYDVHVLDKDLKFLPKKHK